MKIQFKIISIFIFFTTVTFISCNMESRVYALRDTGPAIGTGSANTAAIIASQGA